MSGEAIIYWLLNLLFDTIGQLSFKAASRSADHLDGWAHWKALSRSPCLWLGIASFVLEFVFWLSFLSLVPLAMGLFVGCANMIGVMIGGWLLFHEKITLERAGAIGLIALGVMLVGWGQA